MRTEYDRFLSKVMMLAGCWLWCGAKTRGGYGHFRRKIDGVWKMYKAHRYSYEMHIGSIPENQLVCHSCDNPECVNPGHLYVGSDKQNTQDMMKKGRWKMIRNPKHRLLDLEIARAIRQLKKEHPDMTYRELGSRFNTSGQQAHRVVTNQIWQESENSL